MIPPGLLFVNLRESLPWSYNVRITLDELTAEDPPVITLLEILSLEGHKYMARLHGPEGMKLLSDPQGHTCLFPSARKLQDTLAGVPVEETQIIHPSAYHEMIGLPVTEISPLRITVQRQRT